MCALPVQFQETHLTINDSPGTRNFVMATDPVVDGLSWLSQVDLGGQKEAGVNTPIHFKTRLAKILRMRGKSNSWLPLAE